MTDTAAHLDVDNVEGALVTLPVHDDTDTTSVSATSHHANVAGLELNRVHNLVGGDVNADGVIDLDQRVWVPDGAAIVGVQQGHVVGANADLEDTAQLVLGLLTGDTVDAEPVLKQLKSIICSRHVSRL